MRKKAEHGNTKKGGMRELKTNNSAMLEQDGEPAASFHEIEEAASGKCVGHAIVQSDEAPVGEVAQGVKVHGLPVRHGEKQEEEEGEVEQEVEGKKEEEKSNSNAHVHG